MTSAMARALLLILVLLAFASNSILNRLALLDGTTGPAAFAALRLAAGAAMLCALVALRNRAVPRFAPNWWGIGSLTLYMLGFSFAYVTLPAGLGALILFGGVQMTMFAGAVLAGEGIPARRWVGSAVAFAGLVYLLWPAGVGAPPVIGSTLMAAAALGWGIYSLVGRGATDPLAETASNFLWATPFGVLAFVVVQDAMTLQGALLALLAGAVTSGLGYALWYHVLPALGATRGAIAQLTVPLIAMAGGMLFLSEPLTLRFAIASVVVLGGVLIGLAPARHRPSDAA
ncbi:MAG: DMT family transporter [Pseudomonadota bacterium]